MFTAQQTTESTLLKELFSNYDKDAKPTINPHSQVKCLYFVQIVKN